MCLLQRILAAVTCQSYLYVTRLKQVKGMENHNYMTAEARAVFDELSTTPATAGEIAEKTYISLARCQFILTQLEMARLSICQFGCYKRLQ